MANPMRGEADLGDRKLVIDFNSMCTLEKATAKKVPEILDMIEKGLGFCELRTVVQVFASPPMGEDEAGSFIGEVGTQPALKALREALEGFFAPPKKEKGENPLKAA